MAIVVSLKRQANESFVSEITCKKARTDPESAENSTIYRRIGCVSVHANLDEDVLNLVKPYLRHTPTSNSQPISNEIVKSTKVGKSSTFRLQQKRHLCLDDLDDSIAAENPPKLLKLYHLEKENTAADEDETIMCNGKPMIKHLHDEVYDIFMASDGNQESSKTFQFENCDDDDTFFVSTYLENCRPSGGYDSDNECDSEDSNAENYYENMYPDESDEEEKESDDDEKSDDDDEWSHHGSMDAFSRLGLSDDNYI